MLFDDGSHLLIAPLGQKPSACEHMIFLGAETSRFGNIMQQGRGLNQFTVYFNFSRGHMIHQKNRHPADLDRVIHNMLQHLHLTDELITLYC